MKHNNTIAAIVFLLGCSAMLGQVLGVKALKGFGLASAASPFTKVFCSAETRDGKQFETFAADFTLIYDTPETSNQELVITPEIYSKLAGPYQRRNVYGAILAYGPALPETLCHDTLAYALAPGSQLLHELEIPANASHFRIHIQSKTKGNSASWILEPPNNDY